MRRIESAKNVSKLVTELVGQLGPVSTLRGEANPDGAIGISTMENDRPTGWLDTDHRKLWRARRLPQRLGSGDEDRLYIGMRGALPNFYTNFESQIR